MSTYVGPSAGLVEQTLEKMRHMLKKRGADGIQGLARNFRICDTNGSGQLDEEELAKVRSLASRRARGTSASSPTRRR